MATVPLDQPLQKPRWDHVKSVAARLTAPFSAPPIPVLEIAETHGVDVIFANFGDQSDKVAGFCDFGSGRLYVNAEDPINRQTFTMAHELGHWLLHKGFFERNPGLYDILPRFQKSEGTNAFEQEANCFAAHLLVPKRLLTPVKHANVATLASVFGVSREMMENRLKSA